MENKQICWQELLEHSLGLRYLTHRRLEVPGINWVQTINCNSIHSAQYTSTPAYISQTCHGNPDLSRKFWSGEKSGPGPRETKIPGKMVLDHFPRKDMGSVLKVVTSIREPRHVTRKEKQSPEVPGFSLKQTSGVL